MARYNKLMVLIIGGFAAGIVMVNIVHIGGGSDGNKLYNVEANRLITDLHGKKLTPKIHRKNYSRI
jgi:hypothetical protein